jgi:hypothetical protein
MSYQSMIAATERDRTSLDCVPLLSLGTGHSLPRCVPAVSRCKSLITRVSGQLRDTASPTFTFSILLTNKEVVVIIVVGLVVVKKVCGGYSLTVWWPLLVPTVSRWLLTSSWRGTCNGTQSGHIRDVAFFSADITPWWRIGYGAPKSCVPCARSVSRSVRTANKVPSTNLHRPFINNQSYARG